MDDTPSCVSAKQSALGATQYFNTVNIKKLPANGVHASDVGIIYINRNRRLVVVGEVVLRDASNVEGD